ncbi:glycoside hydrolase [Clavulina sp. PMI_390]|nr:glycoside hydrolase [Clavulina sp. PMI_390]
MKNLISFGALALTAATSVFGHGYVQQATLGSTVWPGWNPNVDPYLSPTPQRIFRPIPGNGPVTDLSLIDVQCNGYTDGGFYTSPAALVGSYAAGSQITLNWTTWPDSHKGPLITYIAAAPSNISAWMPSTSVVWAKVAQSGVTNGVWASDTLIANNGLYKFTIPSTLKPGQYLVRHEIIALHAAYSYPGAQVYPSCFQIQVTGSGTKTPTSNLVAFPGAYTASTPGIVYDIYTANISQYTIPGPAVWTG